MSEQVLSRSKVSEVAWAQFRSRSINFICLMHGHSISTDTYTHSRPATQIHPCRSMLQEKLSRDKVQTVERGPGGRECADANTPNLATGTINESVNVRDACHA